MEIEQFLDERGGLRIPWPSTHSCILPKLNDSSAAAKENRKLMAYRCAECHTWYRQSFGEYDYCWTPMSKWRVKRWVKKGLLPKLPD